MSLANEVAHYERRHPKSRALFEEASRVLPGGNTRTGIFFPPFPPYLTEGKGCRVWDIDGNEYLDFLANFTSLILGHAHPHIVEAARAQIQRGTCFAAPTEVEVALARQLSQRVPSMEMVRFTNSGTEATLNALRAARALTGRDRIAKFEGAYHGTHDAVEVSIAPQMSAAGSPRQPRAVAAARGVPARSLRDTLVLPFNDAAAVERILARHRADTAAVIVEPVMASTGLVLPEKGFLELLREITARYGIVLVFDEIITLRLGPGGAQGRFGVAPDLTTTGKIIGGGFPVGAFGGRRDMMEAFNPARPDRISQSGTFNANPVTMAAGVATLAELTPAVFDDLERRMRELAARAAPVLARRGFGIEAIGSLFNLRPSTERVRSYREWAAMDKARLQTLHLALVNEGILLASRGLGALSTPIGPVEIERFLEALDRAVGRAGG